MEQKNQNPNDVKVVFRRELLIQKLNVSDFLYYLRQPRIWRWIILYKIFMLFTFATSFLTLAIYVNSDFYILFGLILLAMFRSVKGGLRYWKKNKKVLI